MSGTISGSGTNSVIKNDSGALWMTGVNTFAGNVTLNSGLLVVSNPSQLGPSTNTLVFNSSNSLLHTPSIRAEGGTLTLSNPILFQGSSPYGAILGRDAVTLNGNITVSAVAGVAFRLRTANYGLVTINGNVSFTASASTLVVENLLSSPVVVNGVISDFGSDGPGGNYNHFSKDGAGTLTLNGTNTYEGVTTITAGVLRITNANALGQSANPYGYTDVMSGGVLDIAGAGLTIPERFRVAGPGYVGDVAGTGLSQTGAIRMRDSSPGTAQRNTLTGAINFAANAWIGIDGAEDSLALTGNVSSSECQQLTLTSTTGTYTLSFTRWSP